MKMARAQLTPDVLREALSYDPDTGSLTWKLRDDDAMFNGRHGGRKAMPAIDSRGYRSGLVFGVASLAHRIIWAMVHNTWPDEIDHINGDKLDNRLSNLRSVSHTDNSRNRTRRKDNLSGVVGVRYCKRDRAWRAQINSGGKTIFLGNFKVFDDAVAARKAAEVQYGYHPNHGREKIVSTA